MSILKCDKVSRAMKKKGFSTVSKRSKHVAYTFYHNGVRQAITTHMSHNNQDIDNFLQKEMAEQMHLSKTEFLELVNCSLSGEDLIEKYTESGLIS